MAYRRRFKRSFRRRARPKTYWLTGKTFSFTEDVLPLEQVLDVLGGTICHSTEVPLFDAGDFASHGGDGFLLHRIVGQIRHVVTTQDGPDDQTVLINEGADVRRSFQKRRVYGATGQSALPSAGLVQHSHLFSQIELGDEDIMHTAEFFQPATSDETISLFIGAVDSLRATLINPGGIFSADASLSRDPWSNFFFDQLGPTVRDIDIHCKRKVMADDLPFLYYDVRDSIGNTLVGTAPGIRLQGYLRFLVTKGR